MIRSRARRTRCCTLAKLSPPGGAMLVSRSQFRCSSGSRSAASVNVRPSQAPKSVSIRSSSTTTSTPSALARGGRGVVGPLQRRGDDGRDAAAPGKVLSRGVGLTTAQIGQRRVAAAGVAPLRRTARSGRDATAAASSALPERRSIRPVDDDAAAAASIASFASRSACEFFFRGIHVNEIRSKPGRQLSGLPMQPGDVRDA